MGIKAKMSILLVVFTASLFLLTYRLGYHPLWDDEALVALAAKGILESGDTSVYIDHNIVAYRGGILIRDGHDRSTPPLASFIAAAAMAVLGGEAWALRLPFALLGWMTVALLFLWLWREDAPPIVWFMAAVAVLGNVSLFLFLRQCRYYSPVLFFSVASAYLYYAAPRDWGRVVLLSLSLAILFAANYLNYFALAICLGADYFLWGRKTHSFRNPQIVFLVLSQVAVSLAVLSVWNPLATGSAAALKSSGLLDKLTLLWLNIHDMSECEFVPFLFLLLVPVAYVLKRDVALLRGAVAFILYLVAISLTSPQLSVSLRTLADIRYLPPLIPLGIFLVVFSLNHIFSKKTWLVGLFSIGLFWTNVFYAGGPWYAGIRSTPVSYVMELFQPVEDPYKPTISWINENVRRGQSILVVPDFKIYPLMYHAPHAVYAWQLPKGSRDKYPTLPPIHFKRVSAPDFMIIFGPSVKEVQKAWAVEGVGVGDFELVTVLPYYWQDLYRPELFSHAFKPMVYNPHAWEEIYIFKRKGENYGKRK
ncbi:MAG TPA: hypothetical protein PLJ03_11990 [Syntrophales bacterium]|nr:hypothetical protein [Syntrophales bacterium]